MLEEYADAIEHAAGAADYAYRYPGAPRAVQRALDYIHANLAARLRLADIAAAARMSPYHFSRTFRKAIGCGPHRYVIRARVERAKALLAADGRLAQVADAAGFSDQSHMSRVFRRFTGLSPKQYRAGRRFTPGCPLQAYFESIGKRHHAR